MDKLKKSKISIPIAFSFLLATLTTRFSPVLAGSNSLTFECQSLNGTPTTVAIVNSQPRQFIRWYSGVGKDAGYTPQKRCEEVTSRLNAQFANGANYITHGSMNNNPVICTTDKQGAGCKDLLFTLDWKNSNPKIVVEDIFMLGNSNFAGIPLRQSGCRTYVNIRAVINGDTVRAKEVCSSR